MKEDWLQVKEIFAGVLRLEPEQRAEFITQHCSGDERLRLEVESLLSFYESADHFLESPAVGEVADRFVADSLELKKGDFLNHYKIIRKIGTGGMGEVYLAEDTKLERRVAIKILNHTFDADESNLKRFFQEAKAASALNHPNIIVVHEIDEYDGMHYIVIEYVQGRTLNDAIKMKNLSLMQQMDFSIQIVNALEAAHAVGIIHRDIKPDNIMLRDDGIVKVLDFGLAKLTDKNRSETDFEAQTRELLNTQAGMIMGTAAYMSPEQTRGKEVDARSDIWSFGVVLFQMVTGRLPFPGETTSDIIAAILKTETPHLAEFVSDIPAELERIVRKTLRKNPNARYQMAGELIEDLKYFRRTLEFGERSEAPSLRVIDDLNQERVTDAKFAAVTAGRTGMYSSGIGSFISEAVSEARERPAFMLLGAATLAAMIVAGFWGLSKIVSTSKSVDGFQNMRLTKLTFDGTTTTKTAISPDGKYITYALKNDGKTALMVRQVATSSVVQLVPPADVEYTGLTFSPDGNRVFYTVEQFSNAGELFEIPVLGGNARKLVKDIRGAVTFSPDSKLMAFRRTNKSLVLADVNGSEQQILKVAGTGESQSHLAWSPDGKTIVGDLFSMADSRYHLVAMSVKEGTERRLEGPAWLRVNGIKWLSDGSGIIISARDADTQFSQVWLVSYPDGETRRVTNDFSTYLDLSLTADDKSLVAVKEDRLYNIWFAPAESPENAKKITVEEGRDEGASGIASATDGKIVYTVRKAATIDIWVVNADGSGNRQLTFDQGKNFFPQITPDGKSIIFVSDRTGDLNIWRMDIDGSDPRTLTDSTDREDAPSITPDGNWVIYNRTDSAHVSTIWKLNLGGGTPVQLTDYESNRPTVSPDGKFFACEYGKSKIDGPAKLAIIPVGGGKPLKILDLPRVIESRIFRWTADSKALMYTDSHDRTDNLWSQTPDDNPPKQLTFFASGQIARFDLGRDGLGFVLSRGNESSDVVMMSDFK